MIPKQPRHSGNDLLTTPLILYATLPKEEVEYFQFINDSETSTDAFSSKEKTLDALILESLILS